MLKSINFNSNLKENYYTYYTKVLILIFSLFANSILYSQFGPSDDFDGDGKINSVDIDDDNDGIRDGDECSDSTLIIDPSGGSSINGPTIWSDLGFQSVILKAKDKWYISGLYTKADGVSDNLSFVEISPSNGYNYTGTIVHASTEYENHVILTTDNKAYYWGKNGDYLTGTDSFNQMTNALPPGYTYQDVVTYKMPSIFFVHLKDGTVWIRSLSSICYGNGITGCPDKNTWYQIKINATTPLTNVKFADMYQFDGMAITNDGKYYSWGQYTYKADNTPAVDSKYAVLLTNFPIGNPIQLQVGKYQSDYVLMSDSTISVLGHCTEGQLGINALGYVTGWRKMYNSGGINPIKVKMFSGNAYRHSTTIIDENGDFYICGMQEGQNYPPIYNSLGMNTMTSSKVMLPKKPFPSNLPKAIWVQSGTYFNHFIGEDGKLYSTGQNTNGSFGNGTTNNTIIFEGYSIPGIDLTNIQAPSNCDYDKDGVLNHLDLDSDNDGCSDAYEGGATNNGTTNYQFPTGNVGTNGLDNSLETTLDNGIINYTSTYSSAIDSTDKWCSDTDNDGIADKYDIDDDNDGIRDGDECSDSSLIIDPFGGSSINGPTIWSDLGSQSVILKAKDKWYISGLYTKADGVSDNLSFVEISPSNGYNYTGTIVHASTEYENHVILTTDNKAYYWGKNGDYLTGTDSFNQMTNALPPGYTYQDVVTYKMPSIFFVHLKDGTVWIRSLSSICYGNGITGCPDKNTWYQIKINATTPLTNVKFADMYQFDGMAITNDGKYYSWGQYTYKADNTPAVDSKYAVLLTNFPIGNPIQLQVGKYQSDYVLMSDSTISVLGHCTEGQLGINALGYVTGWRKMYNSGGINPIKVKMFSGNAYRHSTTIIDENGDFYICGMQEGQNYPPIYNSLGMNTMTSSKVMLPKKPFPSNLPKAIWVQSGTYFNHFIGEDGKLYSTGQNTNGSFGNGTTNNTIIFEGYSIPGIDLTNIQAPSNCDYDKDGILNHLDLDSDNDGCSDAVEGGSTNNGATNYQFPTSNVGTNGLDNSLETTLDNGIINYTSTYSAFALDYVKAICKDADNDGIADYLDIDDDNDGIRDGDECSDSALIIDPSGGSSINGPTIWSDLGSQSVILKAKDKWYISGLYTKADGVSDNLSFVEISPSNGYNYTGTIVHASTEYENHVILTTDNKAYYWGKNGDYLTGTDSFNQMTNALPPGYTYQDVVTYKMPSIFFVHLKDGTVWIRSLSSICYGNGITGCPDKNTWYQIKINATTPLTNVKFADMYQFDGMAITNDGKYYSWGQYTYKADNTPAVDSKYAVLLTNFPIGNPIQLQVGKYQSDYVLMSDSTISVLGHCTEGQLGINALGYVTGWRKMYNSGGINPIKVKMFSGNAYRHSTTIIDENGDFYICGMQEGQNYPPIYNSLGMNTMTSSKVMLPKKPFPSNLPKAIWVQSGTYFNHFIGEDGKLYSTGQNTNGSFGNGTTNNTIIFEGYSIPGIDLTNIQAPSNCDYDKDGILNHLDLDSDNDGCSDAVEGGSTNNGATNYQFPTSNVGTNGLDNSLETSVDNGVINYSLTYSSAIDSTNKWCSDTDNDGIADKYDIDDDNDGIRDGDECNDSNLINNPLYYTSGNSLYNPGIWTEAGHRAFVMKYNNKWYITGYKAAFDQTNLLAPNEISLANGYLFSGNIIEAATGFDIHAILTDQNKIYTWGNDSYRLNNNNHNYLELVNSLPTGYISNDVKDLVVAYYQLVLLMKDGTAWIRGTTGSVNSCYGSGSPCVADDWNQISTAAGTPLTNIKFIDVNYSNGIAYTNDGKYYGWGGNFTRGNNLPQINTGYATLFNEFPTGNPLQVQMGFDGANYVLMDDSTISVIGINSFGQLGINSTVHDLFSWGKMVDSNGVNPIKVKMFAANETYGHVTVIDENSNLFVLGLALGTPYYNRLGLDLTNITTQNKPVRPKPIGLPKAIWTAVGGEFVHFIGEDGLLYNTGSVLYGAFGDSSIGSSVINNRLKFEGKTIPGIDLTNIQAPSYCDYDNDGVLNHLDLDSDGDGCSDAVEGGSTNNGTTNYQFPTGNVGTNGLDNSLETTLDNGIINYTLTYDSLAFDSNKSNCCQLSLDSNLIDITPFSPTTCAPANDGYFTIKNPTFTIGSNYNVSYYKDGIGPISYPSNLTADASNTILLSGLNPGTYSKFSVFDIANPTCVGVLDTSLKYIINSYIASSPLNVNLSKIDANNAQGCNNGQITANVSGGAPPYTYLWSNGATTSIISNLTAVAGGTSYTLTVNDTKGCNGNSPYSSVLNCVNTCDAKIKIDTIIDVLCKGNNTGSIKVSGSSVANPSATFTFKWYDGSNNLLLTQSNVTTSTLSNKISGVYKVTVNIDGTQCLEIEQSITINEPISALSATANTLQNQQTVGGTEGQITVSVSGGTAPYTYLWGTNTGSATSQIVSNLSAGTFCVVVTDIKGCKSTSSCTNINSFTCPNSPNIIMTSTDISCNGLINGKIDVTISGGTLPLTYLWSDGVTTKDRTGLTDTSYTLTVTDALGCKGIKTVQIDEPSLLSSGLAVNHVLCKGDTSGSIDLTTSGGTAPYSYSWSNGATTQDLLKLVAGNYSVTITDSRGCKNNQNANVTEPSSSMNVQLSKKDATNAQSCNNGEAYVVVTGGILPYSYLWNTGSTNDTITDLNAVTGGTTYSVVVTDANNCQANITHEVVLNCVNTCDAKIKIDTIIDVLCKGNNTGSIKVSGSSVANPSATFTFKWYDGSNNLLLTQSNVTTSTLSSKLSGVYKVTVNIDGTQCLDVEQSITINEPISALSATANTIQNQQTVGGTEGQITVSVSGGTAPYTYLWGTNTGSATTQTISNLDTGTYCVIVTDKNACVSSNSCANVNSFTCIDNPNINSVKTDITCFGLTNGKIDVTISGGTLPLTYLWSDGVTTKDRTGLTDTSYTLTVTDALGCKGIKTVQINEPSLLSSGLAVNHVLCKGDTSGSIDLTTSGGTAPYSYSWSNGATTQDLLKLVAGNYSVTITDSRGCKNNQNANVTEPSSSMNVQLSKKDATNAQSCNNGEAYVVVTGGILPYSYLWNTGSTNDTITDLNAVTGGTTYSVVVTDANNCQANITHEVVLNCVNTCDAKIKIDTVIDVLCKGNNTGSIKVSGSSVANPSATFTFKWYDGSNNLLLTQSNVTTSTLSNKISGVYKVTVNIDGTQCLDVEQSITINEPISALSATANTIQNQQTVGGTEGQITVSLSGGTAPYTYLWGTNTGSATTQTISNLDTGKYCVIVTDKNACVSSNSCANVNSFTCIDNPNINSVKSDITCFGLTNGKIDVTISGGTLPLTYLWSDGVTTKDRTGLTDTSYTLTVTDALGCKGIKTVQINEPSLLSSGLAVNHVLCKGDTSGSIDLTTSGGTAPYSYSWSNGATTQDLLKLLAGNYSVTITDSRGCKNNQNANVTEPISSMNVQLSKKDATNAQSCNNGEAYVVVTGGILPYSYLWNTGSTNDTITGLNVALGGTNYSVVVSDANNCQSNISHEIVLSCVNTCDAKIKVDSVKNVLCNGDSTGSIKVSASSVANPNSTFSFKWLYNSDTIFTQINDTISTLNNKVKGTYTVLVTIDGTQCLKVAQNIDIIEPTKLISSALTLQHQQTVSGTEGKVNVSVNGGIPPYSFLWGANTGNATTQTVSNLDTGIYCVIVSDSNNCFASNTCAKVNSFKCVNLPNITTEVNNITCFGLKNGDINITVTGGTGSISYSWSDGVTTEDRTNLDIGTYELTVVDSLGCQDIKTIGIVQPSKLSIGLAPNNVLCKGDTSGSIDLSNSGGTAPYTYNWSNGATTQDLLKLVAGNYSVIVADFNGCKDTVNANVSEPLNKLQSALFNTNESGVGAFDAYAIVNVTGGTSTGNYNYKWENLSTSSIIVNNYFSDSIGGLNANKYRISVFDNNNCSNIIDFYVLNEVLPTDTVSPTDSLSICDTSLTGFSLDTLYLCEGGKYGTTTIDANNCVIYIPDSNYLGNDSICIVVCIDSVCDTVIQPIVVGPGTTDTLPTDTVNKGDTLTYCDTNFLLVVDTIIVCDAGENGVVELNGQCFDYIPQPNFVGRDTICIIVCNDGQCDTNIIPIVVIPTGIDTLPIDTIKPTDSIVICEDTLNGSSLDTIKICDGGEYGTTTIDANNCVNYKPDSNYLGNDTICIIKCVDGICDTVIQPIVVGPGTTDTLPTDTVNKGDTLTYCDTNFLLVVDTIIVCDAGENGVVELNGQCFDYIPQPNFVGRDTICIIVCNDGQCDTNIIPIVVIPTGIDTLPIDTVKPTDSIVICEDTLNGSSLDTIKICDGGEYGTTTIDANNCVNYKPDSNYLGNDTICIIKCVDGICDTVIQPIVVGPGTTDTLPTDTVNKGDTLTYCDTNFLLVVDTIIVCDAGENGVVELNGQCFDYIPQPNFVGRDTICIIVCNDGQCDTNIIPIVVIPTGIDTLPIDTVKPTDSIVICEDTLNGSSLDTIKICDGGEYGTTTIDANNCVNYKPDSNYLGNDTICIIKCVDGICDTVIQPIVVGPGTTDTLPTDTVNKGDTLTYCDTNFLLVVDTIIVCDAGENGVVELNGQCFDYIPHPNFVGRDTICIIVCNDGQCDTNIIPIVVIPTGIDTLPIDTIKPTDSIVICEDTLNGSSLDTIKICDGGEYGTTTIDANNCVNYKPDSNYLGNDTICIIKCVDGICDTVIQPIVVGPGTTDTLPTDTVNKGDTLTYCDTNFLLVIDTIIVCDAGENGVVELNGQCFDYIPQPNFVGRDTICIIVCNDGQCDTNIIPIVVIPIGIDTMISVTVPEDSNIIICDTDINGVVMDNITLCNGGNNGTSEVGTNCITYTPNTNYVGNDTICVITCNDGICDTSIIPIIVEPNDIDSLFVAVPEDSSVTICDTQISSAVMDSVLLCSDVTNGEIEQNGNCITYTPNVNYIGKDSLCIITCNDGVCDTGMIIISVVPNPNSPFDTIVDTVPEDSNITFCDTDFINAEADSLSICNGGNYGVTELNGNCITYTPNPNFSGNDTICVIACNDGFCDTTIITLFVFPKSDTLSFEVNQDTGIFVLCFDSLDSTNSIISFEIIDGVGEGVSFDSIPGTNCVNVNVSRNYVGNDTLIVVTCYAQGYCDTIFVVPTVKPIKDTMIDTLQPLSVIQLCSDYLNQLDADSIILCSNSNTEYGTISTEFDCFTYTSGITQGIDSLCLIICNDGVCDTTIYVLTIEDSNEISIKCMKDTNGINRNLDCIYEVEDFVSNVEFYYGENRNDEMFIKWQTPDIGERLEIINDTLTISVFGYTQFGDSVTCSFNYYIRCNRTINIPEFISPNGDDYNDTWDIPELEKYPKNTVKIFNRYGKIVYEKENYLNHWSGESQHTGAIKNDSKLPTGTYFYVIDLGVEGEEIISGQVNIRY